MCIMHGEREREGEGKGEGGVGQCTVLGVVWR